MTDKDTTSGSQERVAFDLMQMIACGPGEPEVTDRAYYLDLYRQCRRVVRGSDPE